MFSYASIPIPQSRQPSASGLDVPDGLQASTPVEVHFDGIGDQYAKLTVTPPAKTHARQFHHHRLRQARRRKILDLARAASTMPSILWSEPAQTVVHAFDINVPANLRVGYITAEAK